MQILSTVPNSEDESFMAECLRAQLMGIVESNVLILKRVKLPPLYESGVRFERETEPGAVVPDVLTLYERGHGNCAPLACARAAELRVRGVNAGIKVYWRPEMNPLPFHVEVRLPNGNVEDPSRRLGMVGARFE